MLKVANAVLIAASRLPVSQRRCLAQGSVSLSMDFEEAPHNSVRMRECRYAQNNNKAGDHQSTPKCSR
jgi:hypothetical protein